MKVINMPCVIFYVQNFVFINKYIIINVNTNPSK